MADQPERKTVPEEFYAEVFGRIDKGESIPPDLAKAVAGWCVFAGEMLAGSPWLVIAAGIIRDQAQQLERRSTSG